MDNPTNPGRTTPRDTSGARRLESADSIVWGGSVQWADLSPTDSTVSDIDAGGADLINQLEG